MRLITANEATASKRRMFFYCVDATDGMTPETGEAGGQPQISTDGGAFTNTGIGTLTHLGNGEYYADVTQAAVATAGTVIRGRYKSANTAESPAMEAFQMIAFDLNTAIAQTGDAYARLGAPVGASVSADVAAIKSDSGTLVTRTGVPAVTVAADIAAISTGGSGTTTIVTRPVIATVHATVTAATAAGYLTVSSATGLVVGAYCWLSKTNGTAQIQVKIKSISGTSIGVQAAAADGHFHGFGLSNVSAYNGGGFLDQEAQV